MVKLVGATTLTLVALCAAASAGDRVTFGTNWLAQAEHGGFYQAVADGTYAQYGLDVTIRQGGPQTSNRYEPYTFNPAPFLADPMAVQQGYLTSEPFEIAKQAGWTPKLFVLADYGYLPYSTVIQTQQRLVKENPGLVQRFVDASLIGWYNYLYGDNTEANALIIRDNPEMVEERIAFALTKLKEHDIVVSGDAKEKGIGCMTDARWSEFYGAMTDVGVYPAEIDLTKAYTTQFVCKGVGAELLK